MVNQMPAPTTARSRYWLAGWLSAACFADSGLCRVAARRAAIRGGPPTPAAGRFPFGTILVQLLPVLLELLEVLLQLSVVARGQVGFDGLQIGLDLLASLLLLAIVVLQGLTALGEVAQILLNLLTRETRRPEDGEWMPCPDDGEVPLLACWLGF